MKTFGRVLTAMITSFNEDGSVNIENSIAIAHHLLDNGSDGLVVCGTTGENPTMSQEDKLSLFKAIAKECSHKGSIIANVGSNDTRETVNFVKEVSAIEGISGLLVVVPYYNKPNQHGQYLHFKAVAEATTLPIMIYNVPGRVGTGILPSTLAKLHGEYPHINSVKEASGNILIASEINRLMPNSDFMIYSGDDALTLPMLSLGACGVVSVVSHISGNDMNHMIQAFEAGHTEEAKQLHHKLTPIIQAMFVTTNPIPVKYAARKLGLPAGAFNLPMCEPSEEEAKCIDMALQAYLQA
ncbi:4-hydroxy-tetrahydrodipicolinate synthase [Veillonella agrestimuris]|uniref:4-hydroxy-tetrahydrodipicolinate synthase n=1 Tax=Veillonella agrestimuris TaxID=2941340 RepID=UPI0020403735|nr:4-hydroxy-tetrahydrodipicolinate synthase [Veillonella agrestimuris]